ncbi:putative vacuolar protein sorting-associated protein [Clavispora lusitaniae]|uniref:Vacuolar protein sorting-associated protein n=1 Tax=Clavispora lusitaniae TaxID=36911 RepID=A0ACD0WG04_CLALS|nr:putative vacuolar protein sorting-associated protein [Clavispora lusitaniae]QFZ31898.1 putative vacuolar protein sorting-associated protein [Clavispora lusitaniae]QFZ37567.1 putative vacuolar protein sorting-associated protein [Clavispora lusitaniae]QFZ43251.1 putative vacuolar protein sorting-associated protein [Clavispora lusitaniae]QFZ48927.1 putative vacuolar protein sorting-associated protein [Clavispora lusitaniae]
MTETNSSSSSSVRSTKTSDATLSPFRRKRFDDRSQTAISYHLANSSTETESLDLRRLQSTQSNSNIFTSLVHWKPARSMEHIINSEDFVNSFGKPLYLQLSPLHVALGTDKGVIVGFNYHQEIIFALYVHPFASDVHSSVFHCPVTCITFSSDSTFLAAGFMDGTVATWNLNSAKVTVGKYSALFPYGIIHPISLEARFARNAQGHLKDVPVSALSFIGGSNHQLVASDASGLVFYHYLFKKLMRKYHVTQKLLGKNDTNQKETAGKFVIRACNILPIGTVPQITDQMGVIAVMTANILAIVSVCSLNNASSTNPITHLKLSRSRHVFLNSGSSPLGSLAWYPCINLNGNVCNAKLAYAWNNVLTILEIDNGKIPENINNILAELKDKNKGIPQLIINRKARWMTSNKEQAILELKWLNSEILTALVQNPESTETTLIFLYYANNEKNSQLIEVGRDDIDSQQISWNVLDSQSKEHIYQGSFQIFRHTMMALVNSHSLSEKSVIIGKTLKWADKLMTCLAKKDFKAALIHACEFYYSDNYGRLILSGLPHTAKERHEVVRPFLIQIMKEAVTPLFEVESANGPLDETLLLYLQIITMLAKDSGGQIPENLLAILESIDEKYEDKHGFYQHLENFILSRQVRNLSPTLFKNLVEYYMKAGEGSKLTEMICILDASTLSIDMTLQLCTKYDLRECSVYIWNKLLHDYKTPLVVLMNDLNSSKYDEEQKLIVYTYMTYILSGRQFPSDDLLSVDEEKFARGQVCEIIFSMNPYSLLHGTVVSGDSVDVLFPQLYQLLKFNVFEMLVTLNEFFENPCLNAEGKDALNRQYITDALLDVFDAKKESFNQIDFVYLAIFIARNYPKYYQFIRISESTLEETVDRLCMNPDEDLHEDCELSLESLLPFYDMPNDSLLIEKLRAAKFFNVLFGVYRSKGNLRKALELWLEGRRTETSHSPDEKRSLTVLATTLESTFRWSQSNYEEKNQLTNFINIHFEELARYNVEDMVVLANTYNVEHHLAVLSCQDNKLAFQYLNALFTKYDTTIEASAKALLLSKYIQLIAEFDPEQLVTMLANYGTFLRPFKKPREELKSFFKAKCFCGALSVLLRLEGRFQEAVNCLADAMEQTVENNENISSLKSNLDLAMSICSEAKDDKLWKFLVQKLVVFTGTAGPSALELLNQGIYQCFRKIIENGSGINSHQTFSKVFNDILEIATVSNVRSILQDVLVSFFFESETQKIVLTKMNREIYKYMYHLKRDIIKGWPVRNMRCTSCSKSMCGTDVSIENYSVWEDKIRERVFLGPAEETKYTRQLGLIVFKCGHGYHLQCLDGLGSSTVCVMCVPE